MESVRLKINEHMTSVGEEILCVLEKQQSVDVCRVKLDVRVFVLERLHAAAEVMCNLFQREMETLHNTTLHTADQCAESSLKVKMSWSVSVKQEPENHLDNNSVSLPVCKEELFPEHQERSPSLEETQPPQIKEEQEELLQEEADVSTLTLLAVKSEGDDENRETEAVASTSTEHMKTQADVEDCGTSQPTSGDQLLSPHCSQSDVSEDRDEREETREGQSVGNTLDSHKTQNVEGQTLSVSQKMSQDLPSSKQTHSTQSHTGKKGFSCTECGKMFKHKVSLKRHTVVHTGKKPFTCTVCGKGCGRSDYLKAHMRTHTGEKPFTCKVCGKGCGRSDELKAHMRTHTGEKPFTCTVCGKGCGRSSDLKVHMRTHTGEKPFTCTVCGKGCVHSGDLKAHMRTHTGEKNGICTVCGKAFGQSSHLKQHTRTHKGENPFTCTVCGKSCVTNGNLKAHMRTHTG